MRALNGNVLVLQPVDIRQIADKFPDKTGGLRELFDKGPQSAFFLVKFWVSSAYLQFFFCWFCGY